MGLAAVGRLRKNHAIEHATLHLLDRGSSRPRLAARSDWQGISFYGQVDAPTLERAIRAAISALSHGEARLAVHPRCGSIPSVAGLLSLLALLGVHPASGDGHRLGSWASTALAVSSAVLLARPLGEALQARVLTDPQPAGARLEVLRVGQLGPLAIHRAFIGHP